MSTLLLAIIRLDVSRVGKHPCSLLDLKLCSIASSLWRGKKIRCWKWYFW